MTSLNHSLAVVDLIDRPEASLARELQAWRRRLRESGTRMLVFDLGARSTLAPDALEEIVATHQAFEAVGGRCAVVATPSLAVRVSLADPAGVRFASTREAAIRLFTWEAHPVEFRVVHRLRSLRLEIGGVADLAAIGALEAALAEAAPYSHVGRSVVIDLSRLDFVDATCLRMIVAAAFRVDLAGARMRIVGTPPRAMRILEQLDWVGRLGAILTPESFERSSLGWMNRSDGPSRRHLRPHHDTRRESEDLTAELAGTPVVGAVIATDSHGQVTYWDDAATGLYGWSRAEALGRPITELTVNPEDGSTAREIMESVRRTGTWDGEFEVRRKDGTRFLAHVREFVVHDGAGRPACLVGISSAL
jgi:anti-anti-sigma factor